MLFAGPFQLKRSIHCLLAKPPQPARGCPEAALRTPRGPANIPPTPGRVPSCPQPAPSPRRPHGSRPPPPEAAAVPGRLPAAPQLSAASGPRRAAGGGGGGGRALSAVLRPGRAPPAASVTPGGGGGWDAPPPGVPEPRPAGAGTAPGPRRDGERRAARPPLGGLLPRGGSAAGPGSASRIRHGSGGPAAPRPRQRRPDPEPERAGPRKWRRSPEAPERGAGLARGRARRWGLLRAAVAVPRGAPGPRRSVPRPGRVPEVARAGVGSPEPPAVVPCFSFGVSLLWVLFVK